MKGRVYILIAVDINTGDSTPRHAVEDAIASYGDKRSPNPITIALDHPYIGLNNPRIVEVGGELGRHEVPRKGKAKS